MNRITIITIILIIILIVVLATIAIKYSTSNFAYMHYADQYKCNNQCPRADRYREIISVRNMNDLRNHFLLDNPSQDGTDPTGGIVDYSFMFARDSDGLIIPNVNRDISWQEIGKSPPLMRDYDNGIIIELDKQVGNTQKVGAPRIISRKLFKGGLFVFDVEHVPIGCGVWPAIWLNGFVGSADQYHEQPGTKKYDDGIKKLLQASVTDGNKLGTECGGAKHVLDANHKRDEHLSRASGRNVYMGLWPLAGEIDILENTNFSDVNWNSIHGGPLCEVVNGYDNKYLYDSSDIGTDYKTSGVRSVCGATYWLNDNPTGPPGDERKTVSKRHVKNQGLGPYSGCKSNVYKIGERGGNSSVTTVGTSRYNCPIHSATSAGNSQVAGPSGSFGHNFNLTGGGVYAMQWIPKKRIDIWWFPRKQYSKEILEKNNGPLSDNPDPKKWNPAQLPDIINSAGDRMHQNVLIASYILDSPLALTYGCDFNFQSIIVNITLGGGWGGNTMPEYCNVDGKSMWADYITKCFGSDPERAQRNEGVDPQTGCYDGGLSDKYRGVHAQPVFYSESYFKIRQIRVLQKDGDSNVW